MYSPLCACGPSCVGWSRASRKAVTTKEQQKPVKAIFPPKTEALLSEGHTATQQGCITTAHIYINDCSLASLVSSLANCTAKVELKDHLIAAASAHFWGHAENTPKIHQSFVQGLVWQWAIIQILKRKALLSFHSLDFFFLYLFFKPQVEVFKKVCVGRRQVMEKRL